MNLQNAMLSERNQILKVVCYKIFMTFLKNIQTLQKFYWDKREETEQNRAQTDFMGSLKYPIAGL